MERDKNSEQRAVITILVKLGETGKQIFEKLNTVYGEAATKPTMVYKGVKWCQEGRESLLVEDNERSGRPVTTRNEENVKRIKNTLAENCRISIRWLSESLGINRETVLIIKEDVGMRKLCSQIVPKSLSADDKLMRVQVCKD